MNLKEYLLVCAMEECAEVQQCLSKILRFGEKDRFPVGANVVTNQVRLVHEVNDLLATLKLLEEVTGMGCGLSAGESAQKLMQDKKRKKLLDMMVYSEKRKTLQGLDLFSKLFPIFVKQDNNSAVPEEQEIEEEDEP